MKIRFYVPNFVDADPPRDAEFFDLPGLFTHPKINDWMLSPGFTHFSHDAYGNERDGADCRIVSANFENGSHWVVGFMTKATERDLRDMEDLSRAVARTFSKRDRGSTHTRAGDRVGGARIEFMHGRETESTVTEPVRHRREHDRADLYRSHIRQTDVSVRQKPSPTP